jgi:hypothetical protein
MDLVRADFQAAYDATAARMAPKPVAAPPVAPVGLAAASTISLSPPSAPCPLSAPASGSGGDEARGWTYSGPIPQVFGPPLETARFILWGGAALAWELPKMFLAWLWDSRLAFVAPGVLVSMAWLHLAARSSPLEGLAYGLAGAILGGLRYSAPRGERIGGGGAMRRAGASSFVLAVSGFLAGGAVAKGLGLLAAAVPAALGVVGFVALVRALAELDSEAR